MGTDYVEITRLEIAIWVKNSSLVKTPGKGYPFRPILATSSKRSTLAKIHDVCNAGKNGYDCRIAFNVPASVIAY